MKRFVAFLVIIASAGAVGRTQRAEFIVQLFNVFDRVNFNTPAGSLTLANDSNGRPLFGQPNSLSPNINAPARQGEFAVRFQF